MIKDRRKAVRRSMRYTAWILLGAGQLHGCAFADISDTGCRLVVENADIIPDTFTLWLSSNGSAQRKCKVVWRATSQVGIAFEPVVADEGPTLAPHITADIVSLETAAPAIADAAPALEQKS